MPFQLTPSTVGLLRAGDPVLYGNQPDNLVRAEVIGPGLFADSVIVQLLEDYDTNRPRGNSFHKAGQNVTTKADNLWHPADLPGATPSE